ncbi:DUF6959 family protein [Streptomyces virginiae]|uniref:DUF6959 family protein n=1 Tax=Streptomyces virginiae TaxID=1961 RepID=UPI003683758D
MERVEAELFTDGGNDAVVRLPGRDFGGSDPGGHPEHPPDPTPTWTKSSCATRTRSTPTESVAPSSDPRSLSEAHQGAGARELMTRTGHGTAGSAPIHHRAGDDRGPADRGRAERARTEGPRGAARSRPPPRERRRARLRRCPLTWPFVLLSG